MHACMAAAVTWCQPSVTHLAVRAEITRLVQHQEILSLSSLFCFVTLQEATEYVKKYGSTSVQLKAGKLVL